MKKLLALGAAAVASVAAPAAVIAATSGTIEGEMTVPYSCNVVTPARLTLIPTNNVATVSDTWTYDQNDNTTYSLTALSITNSNSQANLSGSIALTDGSSALVTQTSTVSPATGDLNGNYASTTGSVTLTLTEGTAPNFYAGTYLMTSTLSCAQNVGGGEGGGGGGGGEF
jgi:hypothetical protein